MFYAIVALLVYLSYRLFEPFLEPLAWAAILVVLTYPVYRRLATRLRPGTAAMWATVGVTVLLILPMTLVLSSFVKQAVYAVHSIQIGVEAGHYAWVNRLWETLQGRFPGLIPSNLGSIVQTYVDRAAGFAAAKAGDILRNSATFILDVTVTIFAMFYFYKDGTVITRRIRDGLPFEAEQSERLMADTHSLVFATVLSTLAAAAMHGLIGMLTFQLTGIRSPVFWGVLMGFFSFIPLIGTALIWVPLALSLLLGGHVVAGIVLGAMCGGVIGTLDSFIRPYIISGRAEMNMLLVFIGVLGGIEVFGLLGVVLGPIVLAIGGTLLQFYVPGARSETGRVEGAEQTKAAVLE
jgi:predicted PurR-regulated permease PerM